MCVACDIAGRRVPSNHGRDNIYRKRHGTSEERSEEPRLVVPSLAANDLLASYSTTGVSVARVLY